MQFLNSLKTQLKFHNSPFNHWELDKPLNEGVLQEMCNVEIVDLNKDYNGYEHDSLLENLKLLPIWKTSEGFSDLQHILLPGNFDDPIGDSQMLDSRYLSSKIEKFIEEKLKVKRQNIKTYIETILPMLFEGGVWTRDNSTYQLLMLTLANENNLLDDNNHPSNWLHIYVKDSLIPSSRKARNLIRKFNSSQKAHQVHVTLASFLSIKIIFLTLKDWFKVRKLNKLVSKKLMQTSGYLWPLFIKDSHDSMSGIPAMNNLLDFNLFEKAMSELPTQKRGCYLQENMGWEFGFIAAWQAASHKENLMGFPVSAIIYWDLRRFFDSKSYLRTSQYDLPLPNYVGMNGEVSKNMYLSGGYPSKDLIEIESLRYLYLSNYSKKSDKVLTSKLNEIVLLVIGDYSKEKTYNQLNILSHALEDINTSVRLIIKPHPACPINTSNFPSLIGELSTRPIEELLKMSDVVYSSLITSAAIDAYCFGLPIITLLDGKTLNMSPLRGGKGVYFVKNSEDLSIAINTIEATDLDQKKHYFYLDPGLPRWHKWLMDDFDKDEHTEFKS